MVAMHALRSWKLRTWACIAMGVLALTGGVALWWHGTSWFSKGPIGVYCPEDRGAVMKLLKDDWYWLVSEGAIDFSPDYMLDHHAATYHYADNTLSIAMYRTPEDKVAGFVTYHPLEGHRGRIQFLVVAKEFRKKGYARNLMQYAINHLKKQGMCFIEIAVRSSNTPAFNLYKNFGFKEIWSTPDGFLGMSKSLCSGAQQNASPAPVDF